MTIIQAIITTDADTDTPTIFATIFPDNQARSGDLYVGPQRDKALRQWCDEYLTCPFSDDQGVTYGSYADFAVEWIDVR